MNPLDLTGPEFLQFYLVLVLAAGLVAAALRWYLRQPDDEPSSQALGLSAYEVAYLKGGRERAVDAAIARLVREDVLTVDPGTRMLKAKGDEPPYDAPQLHRVLHAAAKGTIGQTIGTVRTAALPHFEKTRQRLQELGLLVADGRANLARFAPLALVLAVPAFGAMKIMVGLSRDRPVGFLLMACILSVVAALSLFGRPVHRSRQGDLALLRLQERNAALETQARRRFDQLASDDVALAFGLFGMGVLAGGPMADLGTAMKPRSGSTSSWSSCGTSGCGGGGSCGGGGGCGGCGG